MKLKKHKDLNSTSQIFWLHILVEGKYSSRKRKQCSSLPPFSLFFAKKKLKRRSACPNPKLLLAYSDSIGVYWKAAESCVVSVNCTQ